MRDSNSIEFGLGYHENYGKAKEKGESEVYSRCIPAESEAQAKQAEFQSAVKVTELATVPANYFVISG